MPTDTRPASRSLHLGLWIAQILTGALFLGAGAWKTFSALPDLVQALPWAADYPRMVRFIGVSELLGGIGMFLPAGLRILPKWTGLAGVGLTTVMALAVIFHLSRGEVSAVPVNLVLGAMTAFVAWGRLVGAPIPPRGAADP